MACILDAMTNFQPTASPENGTLCSAEASMDNGMGDISGTQKIESPYDGTRFSRSLGGSVLVSYPNTSSFLFNRAALFDAGGGMKTSRTHGLRIVLQYARAGARFRAAPRRGRFTELEPNSSH